MEKARSQEDSSEQKSSDSSIKSKRSSDSKMTSKDGGFANALNESDESDDKTSYQSGSGAV